MMQPFGVELPPATNLRELLEQSSLSIFAQCPHGLENETLWEGGGSDRSISWRQLLLSGPSPAQTTISVSRDLSFRESPLEDSTVGDLSLPRAPAGFCRVGGAAPEKDASPSAGDDGGGDVPRRGQDSRDEWLTVAPGLSGGLTDLLPPAGPDGNAPAAADLLTPLTWGEVTDQTEASEDPQPTPPPADDEATDQLLQAAEHHWPVLDTSGAASAARPPTQDGWARQADLTDATLDTVPDPDVMTFDFELDPFQKQAVALMERGENVLVVAHTSAGKTAIAEYAIARALKDGDRVIYTSPVKALSNQKYGELRGRFSAVGLLTGDTQLNPEAPCLICTTEILRSMLYNRPWLTESLRTVVLDEVHYIGDRDRGHIWEECLILLPARVNLVMLSATVPNAMDIAAWVGGIKDRPVYVVSSSRRPVPLSHQLYTGPASDLYDETLKSQRTFTVLDHNGVFSEDNYQLALDTVRQRRQRPERQTSCRGRQSNRPERQSSYRGHQPCRPERQSSYRERRPSGRDRRPSRDDCGGDDGSGHATPTRRRSGAAHHTEHWVDLANHLERRQLLPAIVFVFSRRRCDETAAALAGLDLTAGGEKQRIQRRLRDLETHLSPADRDLQTVCEVKESLLRGIGVHHAGKLPFLKEAVELLFQEGLVKILFATETFATGINMPTRTVIFQSLTKWDGAPEKRALRPAEYVQMSGRAGRRGRDDSGTVIIMAVPHCPAKTELQNVIYMRPDPIVSQFRLTFFMLLNMLNSGRDAADVVWNSFALWGRRSPDQLLAELERLQSEEEGARLSAEDSELLRSRCEELVQLTRQDREDRSEKLAVRGNPDRGQVIIISSDQISRRLAVVIKSSLVDKDAWRRARHTVLVLRDPADHSVSPSPPPGGDPPPGPANGSAASEPASEKSDQDRELARRAAAALLPPPLLRPREDGQVAPHQLLNVGWADVEAVLKARVEVAERVVDDVRERTEMARFAGRAPSGACGAAVGRLAALSNGYPADCEAVLTLPEPPRLAELRRLLLPPYPDTEPTQLAQTLEASLASDRLHQQLRELSFWSDETTAMVRVLQELRFVDNNGQVTGKGRAAIGVGYRQLLITELVCQDALRDLSAAELAALLSTVSHSVPQGRTEAEPGSRPPTPARGRSLPQGTAEQGSLPPALTQGIRRLLEVARSIDSAQSRAGLVARTEEEHLLQFDLVPAVLDWAEGQDLSRLRLPELSDQGSLCRSLLMLDETLRDVRDLAVALEFPRLQARVRAALAAIRRGLPFSPSIYTVG